MQKRVIVRFGSTSKYIQWKSPSKTLSSTAKVSSTKTSPVSQTKDTNTEKVTQMLEKTATKDGCQNRWPQGVEPCIPSFIIYGQVITPATLVRLLVNIQSTKRDVGVNNILCQRLNKKRSAIPTSTASQSTKIQSSNATFQQQNWMQDTYITNADMKALLSLKDLSKETIPKHFFLLPPAGSPSNKLSS